jgi:poly-gamma-glutamate capsule biosynthesis protein CapA/YwtB (metallophosphatase superfamily)
MNGDAMPVVDSGSTVSIALVGDVFISRDNFGDDGPFDEPFREVVGLLDAADVAFGNFEIPLSDRGYPADKFITIRTSADRARDVRRMGLDVVSLANNHIMDYGPEGLFDTMAALDREGVQHVGAGVDLADAMNLTVHDVADRRIGFLAWSTILPPGATATDVRPGVAPIAIHTGYEVVVRLLEAPSSPPVLTWVDPPAEERALDLVARAREEVDYLVVSVHWGADFGDDLAGYERPLGRGLIRAGADLVLGNHPHTVRGIELYHGKPILYGPGLFVEQVPRAGADAEVLALYERLSPDSYLALVDVGVTGAIGLRILPTCNAGTGLPGLARGHVFDRIAQRLVRLSAPWGTELVVDSAGITVALGEGR